MPTYVLRYDRAHAHQVWLAVCGLAGRDCPWEIRTDGDLVEYRGSDVRLMRAVWRRTRRWVRATAVEEDA